MNPAGKNCTVTRIGRLWDAILVTDDGFGALICQKCESQIRLGEWGGGGGVGEPRTGIICIYIYIYVCMYVCMYVCVYIYYLYIYIHTHTHMHVLNT